MDFRYGPLNIANLLLIILQLVSTCTPSQAVHCLASDRDALLRLKSNFINSSALLPTWNSTVDCCRWDGVTCGYRSGAVTALDLSDLSISGKLDPAALFNLTSLTSLNLSFNDLDLSDTLPGSMHVGFEMLPKLTTLDLSYSGFPGKIPMGISNLTNLVSLDLSTEYVTPVTDLRMLVQNMTKLEVLYLDWVSIRERRDWYTVLSDTVPKLRKLSLVDCNLTGGFGDATHARLKFLTLLILDFNDLSSEVPGFLVDHSSLEVLSMSTCGLFGSFPEKIFGLQNLTSLVVSGNWQLGGHIPESIGELMSLESLDMHSCKFSGSIPTSIAGLPKLETFHLSINNFTGELPPFGSSSKRLREISLSFNNIIGLIPPTIVALPSLIMLDLWHNSLTGPIPMALFSHPVLNILDLSENVLSGGLEEFINASTTLIGVYLNNNKLQGPIPRSIFSLSCLSSLLLHDNNFNGIVDLSMFQGHQNLECISLSNNNFNGTVDLSMFQGIQNLEYLSLSNNNFNGMVDLSMLKGLQNLEYLSLSNNNFNGTVDLSMLQGLQNLGYLYLSYNKLTVVGQESEEHYPFLNIAVLGLASCNMSKIPIFLKDLTTIGDINLSGNKISGIIPRWLWTIGGDPSNLYYLNLSSNLLTGFEMPPLGFYNISNQVLLDLHNNNLEGPILLPPSNYQIIDYSNNSLSSTIPHNISFYLKSTTFFSIANNRVSGSIPLSFCDCANIQVLDLSLNNLSGSIPSCLSHMRSLDILNLRGNRLSGMIPLDFHENCKLRTLNLNGNQLQGSLPFSLSKCKNLNVLDVGNNWLVGQFPSWLASLTQLQVLILKSNRFYGPLNVQENKNNSFEMLNILDISSNNFSGTCSSQYLWNFKSMMFPTEAAVIQFTYMSGMYYHDIVVVTTKGMEVKLEKILTIYKSIDISCNGFQGIIPDVIGNLQALTVLNMSHNFLTGSIPKSLGKLKQLESLDLSFNHISGEIPEELTHLNFLSTLNLSYNDLSGSIPRGGQFNTFSSESFLGNPALHAFSLSGSCSPSATYEGKHSGDSMDWKWEVLFIGLGFAYGFTLVVGFLVFSKAWRELFNHHVDGLLLAIIRLLMSWC